MPLLIEAAGQQRFGASAINYNRKRAAATQLLSLLRMRGEQQFIAVLGCALPSVTSFDLCHGFERRDATRAKA